MSIVHEFNEWKYIVNPNYKLETDLLRIESKKLPDIPKELFKYKALDKNGIDSLTNNFIYASHPWELNDPFDCNRDLINFENASLQQILELNGDLYDSKEITQFLLFQRSKRQSRIARCYK